MQAQLQDSETNFCFNVSPPPRNFSEMFFNNFLQSDIYMRKVYLSGFYYKYIKELNELCWALSLVLMNCIKMKLIHIYIIKILKSHPLGELHIRGIRLSPYEPSDLSHPY